MVIRDLTLRSAGSFGSFHLIRLLYDEYMYFLVEQRVAKFRNTDPVVVMGEVRQYCVLCRILCRDSCIVSFMIEFICVEVDYQCSRST